MTVQFYDTCCPINTTPPLVNYADIPTDRVVEDECSGYVCPHCQQYVRFYKVGDSVKWACSC